MKESALRSGHYLGQMGWWNYENLWDSVWHAFGCKQDSSPKILYGFHTLPILLKAL